MLSHSVVSDSLPLHGLQPTRLLCPWGFSRQEYWSGSPCPPPGCMYVHLYIYICMKVKVAQSCPTLCDPMDCIVPGILQGVAFPFSRGSSQPRDQTQVSRITGEFFTSVPQGKPFVHVGDLGLIPGLGRSPGEGKCYSLQYSGLKNSTDCIVHGVTKSQTRLSHFHFHFVIQPSQ